MLIGQALHFGISLFIGLACLAGAWLYLDAWSQRRQAGELSQGLGFIILTIGFLIAGAVWDDSGWIGTLANWLRLFGYLAVAGGNLMEPPQPRPASSGGSPLANNHALSVSSAATIIRPTFIMALPVAALAATILYWRRAYPGLERHLRPLVPVFGVLTLAEAINLTSLVSSSGHPLVQSVTSPLGVLWYTQQALLLVAAVLLGRWIWHYLTKRPQTQIFLMTTGIVTGITMLTTVTITSLIMFNLQQTVLDGLQTSANVLRYAISSQATASEAAAKTLSLSPAIAKAIADKDHATLSRLVNLNPLTPDQYVTEIIVTGPAGDVLLRASDPDRYGDLVSNNALIVRSLAGGNATGAVTAGGSTNPSIHIASSTPVLYQGVVVGTITASLALGNAFVDGLKRTTGLDSTIYAASQRVATTLTGPDGLSRDLGVAETNPAVISTVIQHGKTWNGSLNISNRPYLASYQPIVDGDTNVIGMLAVGQPQSTILATATQALEYTYLAAIGWLILVVIPIFFITRQISRQLR